MLSVTGAIYDSSYLQYGLLQHGWFNIKGVKGATRINKDHWIAELAIPFAGLGVKPDQTGNWLINACRTNWTIKRGGYRSTLISWGLLTEKPKREISHNFEPSKIIGACGGNSAVFGLLQEVAGVPRPVYTKDELAEVKTLRRRFKLDAHPDEFPQIVMPPKLPLESVMFYRDEAGSKKPIQTDAHRRLKRQQILESMQKVQGTLPARPKRSSLKDFKIRVTNTQVRGRYTKRTVHFFVAEGEEVHAFLYEPLNMKPGEKRPGVVGMIPTAKWGKSCFESWPMCNFPVELAMQGFVVIVPDYPSKGGSLVYDFAADRYASGPLKGLFNHMSCIDLLQLHPSVDPDKIGGIGHSLGGVCTVLLAAFDDRVKVAASSCGWRTFRSMVTLSEKYLATEYFMPRLKTVYNLDLKSFPFEYTETIAAIAPRVFISNSPLSDGVHPGWSTAPAAPIIREFYEAYGAKDAFIFRQPKAGHEFPWAMRQLAYKTFRETLNYHPHGELGLLADRGGKEAIPALKKSLDDSSQKNRWVAAHHLAILGDKSGVARMKQDLHTLSSKDGLEAIEVATVLAEMGDSSGYALAAKLAVKGTTHERWRAAVALAHIANTDKAALNAAGMDPLAVLKTMAAQEKDEGVFFVFLDGMHKILRDRKDMIEIFTIAKDSKYHQDPPPGPPAHDKTIAEVFHLVAVRDKDKPYDYK